MIKRENYNIVQVGLLTVLAGVKAFITIGLEVAFKFNSAYNFAETGLPLAAAGFIGLCGLLCLAEVIAPIAVLIINNKKPKITE